MTVVINRNMPSRMAACIDNPRSMQVESVGADRWRSTRTRTIGSIRGVPLTIIPIIRVRHRVPGFAVARAGAGVHAAVHRRRFHRRRFHRDPSQTGTQTTRDGSAVHRKRSTTAVVPPPQLFHHHSCSTTTVVAPPQLRHDHSCGTTGSVHGVCPSDQGASASRSAGDAGSGQSAGVQLFSRKP